MVGQQVEVESIMARRKEDLRAVVASLGDVVSEAGDNDAGAAGHKDSVPRREKFSRKCV